MSNNFKIIILSHFLKLNKIYVLIFNFFFFCWHLFLKVKSSQKKKKNQ